MRWMQARNVSMIAAALVALLTAGPALAQQQQRPPRLTGAYANLAAAAELSDEQKSQLAVIAAERSAALSQWDEANAEQRSALTASIAEARAANNREARAKLQEELAVYTRQRDEVQAKFDARIRGVMTPEQLIKWDAANLFNGEMRRFSRAELTDDQREKVRAMTIDTMKAIHGLGPDSAEKANELRSQIRADIREKVLTDEQRAAMDAPRTRPARTEEAPAAQ